MSTTLTTTGSHKRFALTGTDQKAVASGTIRKEWQAISVIPSTNGIAFRGFGVLTNWDTREARLLVRLTPLAATKLRNTAWRRRLTFTVCGTVKHTVQHSPQAPSFCQLLSRSSQSPCIYNGPWPKANISTRRDCEKNNKNDNGN